MCLRIRARPVVKGEKLPEVGLPAWPRLELLVDHIASSADDLLTKRNMFALALKFSRAG